jgi:hypothetical protein
MLDLRGGITALRQTNPTIANIVFCTFIAAVDHPFPPIDLAHPISKPHWFLTALPDFSHPYYVDFTTVGIAPSYAEILSTIRVLASRFQTAADCASAAEYSSVLTLLCSTMQRLISLPLPCPTPGPALLMDGNAEMSTGSIEAAYLTLASRHALIVHVFAQWVGHQPSPALAVSNARHELQSACRMLLNLGSRSLVLLWVMAVGAVGALGTPERKWFVGHMATLVADLGIGGWEGLKDALRRVIWHEHQDDGTHRVLWEEVKIWLDEDGERRVVEMFDAV